MHLLGGVIKGARLCTQGMKDDKGNVAAYERNINSRTFTVDGSDLHVMSESRTRACARWTLAPQHMFVPAWLGVCGLPSVSACTRVGGSVAAQWGWTLNHALTCAGRRDLLAATAFAEAVAREEPASVAGARFARLFEASKSAKTHHEFMLAGGWLCNVSMMHARVCRRARNVVSQLRNGEPACSLAQGKGPGRHHHPTPTHTRTHTHAHIHTQTHTHTHTRTHTHTQTHTHTHTHRPLAQAPWAL
jgi:hypothetical protein